MENRIIICNELNKTECDFIKNAKDFIHVEIEGSRVVKKTEFFSEIERQLEFPGECKGKVSRFIDWMNELSWYPVELGVCVVINEYENFLNEDLEFKKELLEIFEQDIFPFWEEGVLKYVKNGIPRKFYVILL